jgi:hypothetical protein
MHLSFHTQSSHTNLQISYVQSCTLRPVLFQSYMYYISICSCFFLQFQRFTFILWHTEPLPSACHILTLLQYLPPPLTKPYYIIHILISPLQPAVYSYLAALFKLSINLGIFQFPNTLIQRTITTITNVGDSKGWSFFHCFPYHYPCYMDIHWWVLLCILHSSFAHFLVAASCLLPTYGKSEVYILEVSFT